MAVGRGPPFGLIKCFGAGWRWWLWDTVNALNATELCTFKWLICKFPLYFFKKVQTRKEVARDSCALNLLPRKPGLREVK